MFVEKIVRIVFFLVAPLFLLGFECPAGQELVTAICANNPDLPECELVVFVTSTDHVGDFGGITGGDLICNARAASSPLAGKTFVAWLSSSSVDARDRLSVGRFVRPDGVLVANSIDDLTDGSIANEIRLDENSSDVGRSRVWTATTTQGTVDPAGRTCSDWTVRSNNTRGIGGITAFGNFSSNWTFAFHSPCTGQYPLYCFEVRR
ncbi:MAG: hypothetical protein R3300_20490 [Candidatus Promineifilaceae bacterium]|nr:hypothetical protein [Candidatus Promineifilaceae bacterium]